MNTIKVMARSVLVVAVGCCCWLSVGRAGLAAEVPAVIQDGFKSWAKNGAPLAFDVWKKGSLLAEDSKPDLLTRYFNRMYRILGNFKSYEQVETKAIGANSQIIYLAINFERAAIYARFLMYRTDKDWVVQNMDFSPKPEAIMPWLAFTGVEYGE